MIIFFIVSLQCLVAAEATETIEGQEGTPEPERGFVWPHDIRAHLRDNKPTGKSERLEAVWRVHERYDIRRRDWLQEAVCSDSASSKEQSLHERWRRRSPEL